MRLAAILLVTCTLLSAGAASASTMASISNSAGPALPGLSLAAWQAVSISWTMDRTYRNVAISVPLDQASSVAPVPVDAFLTTQLGAGTTGADQIAHTDESFRSSGDFRVELFSGLTLGPGTYYLTLWSPDRSGGAWQIAPTPVMTKDTGVVIGPAEYAFREAGFASQYVPGADFTNWNSASGLIFDVAGDPVGVANAPEPGYSLLLGTGALLLAFLRRSNRDKQ